MAIIALTPKVSKKIPGSLVAIIVMTVGAYFLNPVLQEHGFSSIATIHDRFGEIKATLPPLTVPNVSWDGLRELLPTAMVIAVLGAIES